MPAYQSVVAPGTPDVSPLFHPLAFIESDSFAVELALLSGHFWFWTFKERNILFTSVTDIDIPLRLEQWTPYPNFLHMY